MAVGIAATAVDLLILWALVAGAGLDPRWANLPALGLGLAVQFFGNKYFAFDDRSRAFVRQGTQFLIVEAGAFALNAGGFHLLVTFTTAPYLLARIAASAAVYVGFSYPFWRWIFRPGASPDAPASEGA